MQVVAALREAGIDAHLRDREAASGDGSWDAGVTVASPQGEEHFVVDLKSRAPYPNELWRLDAQREALRHDVHPLLVVPFVSEPLGAALTQAGWSWADLQGNFDLRAPGLMLRQRRSASPPKPRRTRLPQGSGSLAIIRALIRLGPDDERSGASALAAQAGVSQPRASQVLARLHDLGLVDRGPRGQWIPHREDIFDQFMASYRGPGGSERYYYSLDTVTEVAVRAAAEGTPTAAIASADVGPDLLAAWRRPSVLILYVRHPIDDQRLGLVEARGRDDANVIVREPADRSVFRNPHLVVRVGDADVSLADESQLIWDLHDLGGGDRLEAAGRLREWLLTNP